MGFVNCACPFVPHLTSLLSFVLMSGCLVGGWQRGGGGGGARAGRGRGVGGRAAEAALRAVPGRARRADRDALRPRVLLGLHRGLAQPEARVPAVPRAVRHRRPRVRVQRRLLMRGAAQPEAPKTLYPETRRIRSSHRTRTRVPAVPRAIQQHRPHVRVHLRLLMRVAQGLGLGLQHSPEQARAWACCACASSGTTGLVCMYTCRCSGAL